MHVTLFSLGKNGASVKTFWGGREINWAHFDEFVRFVFGVFEFTFWCEVGFPELNRWFFVYIVHSYAEFILWSSVYTRSSL